MQCYQYLAMRRYARRHLGAWTDELDDLDLAGELDEQNIDGFQDVERLESWQDVEEGLPGPGLHVPHRPVP